MNDLKNQSIYINDDSESIIEKCISETSPDMSRLDKKKSCSSSNNENNIKVFINNKENNSKYTQSNDSNNSDESNDSDESDNSDDSDESDNSDNSDLKSDDSDHIDKKKGDHNLGVILNGNYILLEKIGYGTFSAVWLAYKLNDNTNKHFYAIKVQHPEDYYDGMKEAKYLEKLKTLNCPYIIHMYESFTYNDPNSTKKTPSICMVFDLMVGSTYQVIKKGKYENGFNEKIVVKIIEQISEALKTINKKLNGIHTDIKPENILIKGTDRRLKIFMEKFLEEEFSKKFKIMLDKLVLDYKFNLSNSKHKKKYNKTKRDLCQRIIKTINININNYIEKNYNIKKDLKIIDIDENIHVVIADFGTLKLCDKTKYSDDIQTRYYRSPEVILMCGYDHKVDIWSLACTAYELLTGSILFNPEKDKKYSTDFHHINWIIELLGDIPKSMISKSKNSSEFFHSNGKFREKKPELHSLSTVFKDVEIKCSNKMIILLEKMLIILPNNRYDYDDIIKYIESNFI